jgi:hypothetical protein
MYTFEITLIGNQTLYGTITEAGKESVEKQFLHYKPIITVHDIDGVTYVKRKHIIDIAFNTIQTQTNKLGF